MQRFSKDLLSKLARIYLILLALPFPLMLFPNSEWIFDRIYSFWLGLFQWFNQRYWNLEIPLEATGSGDQTLNYFIVFALFLVALGLALAVKQSSRFFR